MTLIVKKYLLSVKKFSYLKSLFYWVPAPKRKPFWKSTNMEC